MEMLKLRESYEEKLKQKGDFNSVTSNSNRSQKFPSQPANNRQLETIHDFGDDNESSKSNLSNGRVTILPKLISTKPKNKVISGDEDLPMGTCQVSKCGMCGMDAETQIHLFLSCKVVRRVREDLLRGSGLDSNNFQSIGDLLRSWKCNRLTRAEKFYWDLIPHALWWSIWLARNQFRFEEQEVVDWRILQHVTKLLWSWELSHKELEGIRLENLIFDWRMIMYS